jgi:hypothetical protein
MAYSAWPRLSAWATPPSSGVGPAGPVARTGIRAAVACLAALVALSAVAGCSVKARDLLSAASLQAKISAQLAESYGVPPPHVHCPAAVPAVVGSSFSCTTRLDGQPLTMSGEVAGPRGSVAVKPATAVVVVAEARAQIGRALARTFDMTVGVSCSAPALLVAPPGRTFGCTAEVGGVQRQVVVTVTTTTGTLRLRLLPYRPA